MASPPPRRRFTFQGTQRQYVEYLEKELRSWRSRARSAEKQLAVLRSQAATQHSIPDGILDLSFKVETPETFNYDNSTPIEGPKWEAATSDFLARVPTTKAQWLQRRMEVQLSTPEQIINAFHLLTFRRHQTRSSYPSVELAASPLEAVGAYRDLLSFLQRASRSSTQLYNYSQLLFFCVCCVARGNGLTVEEVDAIVKKQLPEREASSKYMSRLRRAAQWTAQLIDELEDILGHLAPSLFLLLGGPAMKTYREYTTWAETAEYLAREIKAKTKPLLLKPPDEARVSFSPAFLIAYVGPWT
ncbi:hypothetical protein N657DRAFT_406666 [Parathielavia appendiculata]|uniref:Uncharacterized protein n=1 Tax=Parathielavia appendiculata TaxID=2587402 RepID=A0AAN6YXV4_9PEZI|nr:hypothetical protein N657DRAFT_406666 [Parathielavia appendiculata]